MKNARFEGKLVRSILAYARTSSYVMLYQHMSKING
jgi:hypothetical protein